MNKRYKKLDAKMLERFIDQYLIDFNATRAMMAIGYSDNEASCRTMAWAMLQEMSAQKMLEEKKKQKAHELGITRDRILHELAVIGFSNIQELFDDNGQLRPVKDMPASIIPAVASIQLKADKSVIEVKLWNKLDALEKLLKHLGIDKPRDQENSNAEAFSALKSLLEKCAPKS